MFCTCADLPSFAVACERLRKACRNLFFYLLVFSTVFLSLFWAAAYNDKSPPIWWFLGGIGMFGCGWLLRLFCYLFPWGRPPAEKQRSGVDPECRTKVLWWRLLLSTLAAVLAGAVGGGLCYLMGVKVLPLVPDPGAACGAPLIYATLAVPLLITVYLLAGVIHILLLNS